MVSKSCIILAAILGRITSSLTVRDNVALSLAHTLFARWQHCSHYRHQWLNRVRVVGSDWLVTNNVGLRWPSFNNGGFWQVIQIITRLSLRLDSEVKLHYRALCTLHSADELPNEGCNLWVTSLNLFNSKCLAGIVWICLAQPTLIPS